MACCSGLDMAQKEEMIDGELRIYMACKSCGVKVRARIFPISGGNAETTEYSCPRCGNWRRRSGRPTDEMLALVELTSDWRKKK